MKVALLGYGLEAQSAYNYYVNLHPDAEFVIYDNAASPKMELPKGATFHGGMTDFHDIDADIVVRTPAISPDKVSTRGVVTSVTKEFFDVCQRPIIGVTGTKGKGTTCSLIAAMLKEAGIKTWLVGNIGLPALDMIKEINEAKEGVVVYELSSFQLWDMTKSPHVAVLLMIEPEHLDVHSSFAEYVEAKSNLVRHQTTTDTLVYFEPNDTTCQIAALSAGKKIPYSVPQDGKVVVDGQEIATKGDIALYGAHNIGNVQAAAWAAWQFTQDVAAMRRAIQGFKGLPHRLEEVAVKHGVRYINDSFSSAPPASVAAVRAFEGPKVLIMGGFDRGLDFSDVVRTLATQPDLKKVVLIGQTGQKIADEFDKIGWHSYEIVTDGLPAAVMHAKEAAGSNSTVILSPGCPSFDMFKDFVARGNEFKELVAKL